MHKATLKAAERFEEDSKNIHGNSYDYSKVNYTGSQQKVIIMCPKHGDFSITPQQHLRDKSGYPECNTYNKPLTSYDFTNYTWIKTLGEYQLKSNYVNALTKVKMLHITCGNTWEITPNKFKMGRRCPKCRKASDNDIFYIWKVNATNMYKLGVTSARLDYTRTLQVASKVSKELGIKVTPNIVEFIETKNAFKIERYLLNKYTKLPTFLSAFDGSTEFRELTAEELGSINTYLRLLKE